MSLTCKNVLSIQNMSFKDFIIDTYTKSFDYSKQFKVPKEDASEKAKESYKNKIAKYIDSVSFVIDSIAMDSPALMNKLNSVISENPEEITNYINHCDSGDSYKKVLRNYKKAMKRDSCKGLHKETAYTAFGIYIRPIIVEENKDLKTAEVMRKIGECWKKISENPENLEALDKIVNELNEYKTTLVEEFNNSDKSKEIRETLKTKAELKRLELFENSPNFSKDVMIAIINGKEIAKPKSSRKTRKN